MKIGDVSSRKKEFGTLVDCSLRVFIDLEKFWGPLYSLVFRISLDECV
jgi:hypothetical protein